MKIKSTFLYVDISSIDRKLKLISKASRINHSNAPSRARKVINENDVIISTVRPNLNAVSIVPAELDNQIASTGFCILKPNSLIVCPKYLYYYSMTQYFVESLSKKGRGALYPSISDTDVFDMQISLPSLSEQKEIVKILDEVNKQRLECVRIVSLITKILPLLFYNLIGKEESPKCPILPLKEVAKIGSEMVDSKDIEYSNLIHIGGENLEKSTGRILSPKKIKDSDIKSKNFYFTEHHVLYSSIRPYLDKVSFPQINGLCTPGIYPIIPLDKSISSYYLIALLRSSKFLSYANSHATGTRSPKIKKTQIEKYEIPIPDGNVLAKLNRQVKITLNLEKRAFALQDKIEKIFSNSLEYGFSGNLTLDWRNSHSKEISAELKSQLKELKRHNIIEQK